MVMADTLSHGYHHGYFPLYFFVLTYILQRVALLQKKVSLQLVTPISHVNCNYL